MARASIALLGLLVQLAGEALAEEEVCDRAAASAPGGSCERDEASHLQVQGAVRSAAVQIGSASPSISEKRLLRRRRRRHVHSVVEADNVEYFFQGYGGAGPPWSWFTGVVGNDVVTLAGVSAPGQRFGLAQVGNMPMGNVYPDDGPSAADGIMGLMPGCVSAASKECLKSFGRTDVITHLNSSGAISAHAFTICLHNSEEGGGMFYVGASSSPFPEGTVEVPLIWGDPTDEGDDGYYRLFVPPEGVQTVPFYFGDLSATMDAADFNHSMELGNIDSGSNGFTMPDSLWDQFMPEVSKIWAADDDIVEAMGGEQLLEVAYNCLKDGNGTCELPPGAANKMIAAVPDFIFTLGDANVSVLGVSMLYQTSPCSGQYAISWLKGSDSDSGPETLELGSSFFYGRSLQFDLTQNLTDLLATDDGIPNSFAQVGRLSLIPDDKCEANYGESDQGAEVVGPPAQVLGSQGVMSVMVGLGTPPQMLRMQLDTGSQDLLLSQNSCMLTGLGDENGCFYVDANHPTGEFSLEPYTDAPDPSACESYNAGLMNALNWTLLYNLSTINAAIAQSVEPWETCDATRAYCGIAGTFDVASSSTVMPKNLPSLVFKQQPPPFNGSAVECDLCGAPLSF